MVRIPDAASVALFDRDKVLLIQRARQPYLGLWSLPGGRLEPGETAEQAAGREVMEELGLTVRRLHPVRQLSLAEGRFVLQVFATQAFEGEIVASEEVANFRWARPEELAQLRTTPDLETVVDGVFRLFDRS